MVLINALKSVINFLSAPQYLVTAMLILLVLGIRWRPLWTTKGGIVRLVLGAGAIGLSYLDPNFAAVATLPDNVPIVGMIFLVGFFFWFAMNQAYENDRRIAAGLGPIEAGDSAQKVFFWPELVYGGRSWRGDDVTEAAAAKNYDRDQPSAVASVTVEEKIKDEDEAKEKGKTKTLVLA